MTVHTCTKVNIGLHVLRRRPDGYHDLETLFVPYYGLGDDLTIDLSTTLAIAVSGATWDPWDDLTIQAWRLLKRDFPDLAPVKIVLQKHAPVGAGLGGGSADGAYALRCINELARLGLGTEQLAAYASRLGSDCAFFMHCRPMLGTGRGEVLTPFDLDLSAWDLRVEVPEGVAVSTREAYSGIVPRDDRQPLAELLKAPVEQWRGLIVNDFEETICQKYPQIAALKEKMYSDGAIYAAMSGSGSAVFGLFPK